MTQEALLNSHLGYDILYELIVSGMFKFLCTKQVGTLLYLRVVKTNIGMNPELSCTEASGKAALFGPLRDGFMFETSTGLSRM
jgi:exosome complex RNA-binding protein Rrp4